MAIVLGVLTALAVISAIGSASKVQRQRAASGATRSQPAKSAAPLPAADPQSAHTAPSDLSTVPAKPAQSDSIESGREPQLESAASQPSANPIADELAESILENMPELPLAASLLVSEVVNPEGNDLGMQLDRLNSAEAEAAPVHHSANLLDEIAELEPGQGGDRVAHLAQFVEHPDSVMRVSAAFALGDLATRAQGTEKDEIIQILLRLSQDVDPQVRVQAASALGGLEHSGIPTLE